MFAAKSKRLYHDLENIKEIFKKNPIKGLKRLVDEHSFGKTDEHWDFHVFNVAIRPYLEIVSKLKDLDKSIDIYSAIDHDLFLNYIRRDEKPERFKQAFWDVNYYGLNIAERIQTRVNNKFNKSNGEDTKKKILIVLKGVYKLAHCEFLTAFLDGCSYFRNSVEVHLLLLDEKEKRVQSRNKDLIIHSFLHYQHTSRKINKYLELCNTEEFDSIVWVACVQNLGLFMGLKLAERQSYWSMKYHSIIMPSINGYAGLGFGGNSFEYDGIKWYRGRCFPRLDMPKKDNTFRNNVRRKYGMTDNSIAIGCFVRAEKLYSKEYFDELKEFMKSKKEIHYFLASQSKTEQVTRLMMDKDLKDRVHFLGWIDTKKYSQILDIYADVGPRGSGNTIFEAVMAGIPCLMFDTELNRESSALPYLTQGDVGKDIEAGIAQSNSEYFKMLTRMVQDRSMRKSIHEEQFKRFKEK